jgi:hypothetical protein
MIPRRLAVAALTLALANAACHGPQPLAPTTFEKAPAPPTADASGEPQARTTTLPDAVFLTTPPNTDGRIEGPSPLAVEFNLCRSRPTTVDDDLKYTYDFDGDGTADTFGHCRAQHTFSQPGTVKVCVSDRSPDGAVCRTYDVRPSTSTATSSPDLTAPDHVVTFALHNCGQQVENRHQWLDVAIEPPLPAGQPYSVSLRVEGEMGAAAYDDSIAALADYTCEQFSPYSTSTSPLPSDHVVSMTPRCAQGQINLVTAIYSSGGIADRMSVAITGFEAPGRTARIEGLTRFTCP